MFLSHCPEEPSKGDGLVILVALGAWESKEGLRPLGSVLALLMILPEGKTEVERSCLG